VLFDNEGRESRKSLRQSRIDESREGHYGFYAAERERSRRGFLVWASRAHAFEENRG